MSRSDFDVEWFLSRPLTARVATNGPTARPAWFLWEDVSHGRRKLARYLGADETSWDERFRRYLREDPARNGTIWLRLRPASLAARDLSYAV